MAAQHMWASQSSGKGVVSTTHDVSKLSRLHNFYLCELIPDVLYLGCGRMLFSDIRAACTDFHALHTCHVRQLNSPPEHAQCRGPQQTA